MRIKKQNNVLNCLSAEKLIKLNLLRENIQVFYILDTVNIKTLVLLLLN